VESLLDFEHLSHLADSEERSVLVVKGQRRHGIHHDISDHRTRRSASRGLADA